MDQHRNWLCSTLCATNIIIASIVGGEMKMYLHSVITACLERRWVIIGNISDELTRREKVKDT